MTKEETAAYQKAWREANKEGLAAKKKAWYEANKEEILAERKAHYEANKEEITAYKKAYYKANRPDTAAKRYERNLMLFNYKGAACNHCGLSEPDHLEIYDYHHIDPSTKLYGVAAIIVGPKERLMTEADKCLLLCSNCHRKEHVKLHKEQL
jgi:5-methylcytosine-specific restriction endonuclease McrA